MKTTKLKKFVIIISAIFLITINALTIITIVQKENIANIVMFSLVACLFDLYAAKFVINYIKNKE